MMPMFDSARSARELQAVLAGQDQIQDHQVDRAIGQDLAHLRAVRGRADPVASIAQVGLDHAPDLGFVIDDQDVFGFAHRLSRMRSVLLARRLRPPTGADFARHGPEVSRAGYANSGFGNRAVPIYKALQNFSGQINES